MEKQIESILLKTTSIIHVFFNNQYLRSATCFFCKNFKGDMFLVTNNHAIESATSIKLVLTLIDGSITDIEIEIKGKVFKHVLYDICVIRFSSIYNILLEHKFPLYLGFIEQNGIVSDFSSFNRIEDIIMVGYPNSIYNESANLPIVRKGITATGLCDKYNNFDLFVIDIPTFGGSSGSPIFILNNNEPILVGINFRNYIDKIPINKNRMYHKRFIGTVNVPNSLGIAIKSNILLELIN